MPSLKGNVWEPTLTVVETGHCDRGIKISAAEKNFQNDESHLVGQVQK